MLRPWFKYVDLSGKVVQHGGCKGLIPLGLVSTARGTRCAEVHELIMRADVQCWVKICVTDIQVKRCVGIDFEVGWLFNC